jgi:hypothetical protein
MSLRKYILGGEGKGCIIDLKQGIGSHIVGLLKVFSSDLVQGEMIMNLESHDLKSARKGLSNVSIEDFKDADRVWSSIRNGVASVSLEALLITLRREGDGYVETDCHVAS